MTPPPRRGASGQFGVGRCTAGLCEVFEAPGSCGTHDLGETLAEPHQNANPADTLTRREMRA